MKTFFRGLLDLIYPELCVHCSRVLVTSEHVLCLPCSLQLPVTNFHLEPENEMIKALWGRIDIQYASSFLFFKKGGITQTLLHQLKYKSRKDIGRVLGHLYGTQIRKEDFIKCIDYILPVPLHKSKLRARGYNQSEEFGRGLSEALGIPLSKALQRKVMTPTQTNRKRFERWVNVSNKFVLENPECFEGKTVILVDDVFTTGATVEACYHALQEAKKLKVGVITLAIAVH